MSARLPVTGRTLIALFAAVATSFTVGLGVAQVFNFRVHEVAAEVVENASPSVVYLSSMMGTLRELQVRSAEYLDTCREAPCGSPARPAELLRELARIWSAYRELPPLPGELARWPAIDVPLAELDRAVDLTLAAAARGDATRAQALSRRALEPAAERLQAGLAALIAFDYDRSVVDARRVDLLTRRALLTAVVVDVLSLTLTALAAVLAIRVVRRYERKLRDRAQELEAFAGRVAHDIKGPLGGAALALHLMRSEVTAERGAGLLERARRGIARVQLLVDGLLEFARAGATPARGAIADLREVVEDVVAELGPVAEEQRVALRVARVVPAQGTVACSPGVLTSILSNVVRNAITHMGSSPVREVEIRSGPGPGAGDVRVEVEDTGPGVSAAVAGRLFEPFVRGPGERSPGSGLGLATARRLVTAHGGRIGFASPPGRGAVFWFEMPRPPGAEQGSSPPAG